MKDTFGINMKQYCRDHSKAMEEALREDAVTPALMEYHREKIRIVQHERLIHLIVTLMVTLAELFAMDLVLLHPNRAGIAGTAFVLVLTVLLGFYFYHYFFLENTVQHWYRLLEEMREKEKQ